VKHEEIWSRLDEYYDEELSPEAEALVREHVRTCAECRDALAERGTLSRTLAEAAKPAPSGDFVRAVGRRIAGPEPAPYQGDPSTRAQGSASGAAPAPWGMWPVPALAVALVAVAFIAVGLALESRETAGLQEELLDTARVERAEIVNILSPAESGTTDNMLGYVLEES